MFLKILGWIWLVTGIIFLVKPEWFKNSLQKKGIKKVKRFLFGITLVVGILFIKASFQFEGAIAIILLVIGIIGLLKAFLFISGKAADKMIEFFADKPLKFFRIAACGHIAFALFLIFIK